MFTLLPQGRWRSGRTTNRVGVLLLIALVTVLAVSVYHGIRTLAVS